MRAEVKNKPHQNQYSYHYSLHAYNQNERHFLKNGICSKPNGGVRFGTIKRMKYLTLVVVILTKQRDLKDLSASFPE